MQWLKYSDKKCHVVGQGSRLLEYLQIAVVLVSSCTETLKQDYYQKNQ